MSHRSLYALLLTISAAMLTPNNPSPPLSSKDTPTPPVYPNIANTESSLFTPYPYKDEFTTEQVDFVRNFADLEANPTAEDPLQKLQRLHRQGRVTDSEFRLAKKNIIAIETELRSDEAEMHGERQFVKLEIPGNSYTVQIPKNLLKKEEPFTPMDRRTSKNWQKYVKSNMCDAYGEEDTIEAHERCGMCEYVTALHQAADMWSTADKVRDQVNILALTNCDRLKEFPSLPTATHGRMHFQGGSVAMAELCIQYRDEISTRMSASEQMTWFQQVVDETAFDWKALDLHNREDRCYSQFMDDVVARMCVQNGCCVESQTLGCPVKFEGCLQCEELVNRRKEKGAGSYGFSTMKASDLVQEVDVLVVVQDLSDFVDGTVSDIDAKIVDLETKLEKARQYFVKSAKLVKSHLADLLGHLHPVIKGQCHRVRKQLDLLVDERAHQAISDHRITGTKHCYRPKNVGKKRNVFNHLAGTQSCLDVYSSVVRSEMLGTETVDEKATLDGDILCAFVVEDLIERLVVPSLTTTADFTFDEFLENPKQIRVFGPPQNGNMKRARQIAVGTVLRCCGHVVSAWRGGETGHAAADACDVEAEQEIDDAMEAAMLEYRGEVGQAFREAHHLTELEMNGGYHPNLKKHLPPKTITQNGDVAAASTMQEALREIREHPGGAVEGVHKLKTEIYDENGDRMMDEITSIKDKISIWKRYRDVSRSRQIAAMSSGSSVTTKSLSMTSEERWLDLKKHLPGRVRDLDTCARKKRAEKKGGQQRVVQSLFRKDVAAEKPVVEDPITRTKGFERMGPEFFLWLKTASHAVPKTAEGLCSLVYPLCTDSTDVARHGRELGCRDDY